jgi:hypothetical protein
MSYFLSPKNRLFLDHVYHAIHHNFTTIYHHLHHRIRKNPCKTATSPHQNKFFPKQAKNLSVQNSDQPSLAKKNGRTTRRMVQPFS